MGVAWVEEKEIGLEPEPLPCHTGMGCPPPSCERATWKQTGLLLLSALIDAMLVLIGYLPPFPAAITGMMTTGNF